MEKKKSFIFTFDLRSCLLTQVVQCKIWVFVCIKAQILFKILY